MEAFIFSMNEHLCTSPWRKYPLVPPTPKRPLHFMPSQISVSRFQRSSQCQRSTPARKDSQRPALKKRSYLTTCCLITTATPLLRISPLIASCAGVIIYHHLNQSAAIEFEVELKKYYLAAATPPTVRCQIVMRD